MSRYLVLLSTLGVVLADYSSWSGLVDATVTKVVSKTAYVCPCNGHTSYGLDWDVWEGLKTDVSATTQTGSNGNTWSTTRNRPESAETTSPSNTRCYTTMGTNSGFYGTSWFTSYTSCTRTVTSTVDTTISMVTTSTITDYAKVTTTTTAPTDTLTSTSTETDTAITTTTATDTALTTTTTTSTSTSTIAAPSGFVPVQSSLIGSSYSGSGGPDPLAKRDSVPAHPPRVSRNRNSKGLLGFSGYPNGVSCIHWTTDQCSSLTTTMTNTYTQSSSTTITTIVTTTLTSTVVPSATTTITTRTTTTSTATTTTTTTSTETDTATATAATSVYAACATNNLADTFDGQIIGDIQGPAVAGYGYVGTTTSNAYECCVAALLLGNAEISWFIPTNECAIYTALETCTNGQLFGQWGIFVNESGYGQTTVSNSNCGEFNALYN